MKQPAWAKWKMHLETSKCIHGFWWVSEDLIQHSTQDKPAEMEDGEFATYAAKDSGLIFESLIPVSLENK